MLAKYEVINALQTMPETINFSEIIETIEIIAANRKAMSDIEEGRVYTTEEAKSLVMAMAKPQ